MSTGGKRVVFAGYGEFGCVALETVLRHGWEVALVYTHEDRPGENCWWRSLAELAAAQGIPVETADINDPPQAERMAGLEPDYLFSSYYRAMVKPQVLKLFPMGGWNLHGSLLPKYRGRAPLNWVLVEGEIETGVTLHEMVEKPDAGDIVDQEWVPVEDDETAYTLMVKMLEATVNVFDRTLQYFERGKVVRLPNEIEKGSYRGARTPEMGRIDFSWPAKRCFDLVRAVTHPWPGAYAQAGQHKHLIWWAKPVSALKSGRTASPGTVLLEDGIPHVACGQGFLKLERVAPAGLDDGPVPKDPTAQRGIDGKTAASRGLIPEGMQFFAGR